MSDKKAYLLLNFAIFSVLIFLFRSVLWHPNDFLFASTFDGIKNYYTFIYYILYDKGIHFSGMNYPFGEHVVYTDNQPLFSFPLRLVNRYLWDISDWLIGIFNYILIFSILLGGIIIFKILRKCLLPPWYSILAATTIVFLAQQNNMFGPYYGAYALSYTWVIPLQWLLIIKTYEEREKYGWFIIAISLLLGMGFIHPYYLLFSFLLVFFHLLIFLVYTCKQYRLLVRFIWLQCSLAILPLVIFKFFLLLSDSVNNRPSTPLGLTKFRGTFGDIFYPWNSLMGNYLQPLFGFEKSVSNGYGYIGLVGILCCFISLIKIFKYIKRNNYKLVYRPVLPYPLLLAIWPAIFIMLFALGFPFRLNLEFLYEMLPFIKQFRVLSRFLWAFYYIFSIYTAFYFYQLFRYLNIKGYSKLAVSFLTLSFISWAIDAKINISETALLVRQNDTAQNFLGKNFNYNTILSTAGYSTDDFQAILPIPYFTAGSEKITIQPFTAMPFAMAASIQTGLPLINGMMSRTSLQQALKSIQLMSSAYIEKGLLQKLPSNNPLLLLVVKDKFQYYEENLIKKGELLFQNKIVSLYKLPLNAFDVTYKTEAKQYFETERNKLFNEGSLYKSKPVSNFFISTFENYKSDKWLFKKGALTAEQGPLTLYYNYLPNAIKAGDHYECSVWINLNTKSPPGIMKYRQYDIKGQIVDVKDINVAECIEIYKDWVNVYFRFILQNPNNRIKLLITGADVIADELLIRPIQLNIYDFAPNKQLIFNNFLIN